MSIDISVMLTSFKRPQNLAAQLEAVRNQSIKPARIVIWHNGSDCKPDMKLLGNEDYVFCKSNWGVWPRMEFCRNFDTELCVVLDDDTVPGRRAFEVCYEALQETGGVIGGNGVCFSEGTRWPRQYIGLDGHRDEPVRVDIVGHLWFFMRDWLRDYSAADTPRHPHCGEDYHWSFVTGNNCWVPRRDLADAETWTSLQPQLGTDNVALYLQDDADTIKENAHNWYRAAGWKTLYDLQEANCALG